LGLHTDCMKPTEFVGYVGTPDFHDGEVLSVSGTETLIVRVRGFSGREYKVQFDGVESVNSSEPQGMDLYALSEMRAPAPLRRFEFANNNEDDRKFLGVLAAGFRILPDDSNTWQR
jgi:hypothetical protein